MLIAIDPGTNESAIICQIGDEFRFKEILPNHEIIEILLNPVGSFGDPCEGGKLLVEMIASYGMPVGKDVFETCVWIGRFIQAWGMDSELVYRKNVKRELCGSIKAKDANVRQALLDLYPATGEGKTPQIGTIKKPGPLFGFKSHLWSALAVLKYYELSSRFERKRVYNQ